MSESLRPTASYQGYCLRAVRTALAVPALYPSARAAWEAVEPEQRSRSVPPVGVPVWWEVGQFWHVALSAGHGVCWSVDIRRSGRLDVVPIALVTRRWNARYLGWSNRLNGRTVPLRP